MGGVCEHTAPTHAARTREHVILKRAWPKAKPPRCAWGRGGVRGCRRRSGRSQRREAPACPAGRSRSPGLCHGCPARHAPGPSPRRFRGSDPSTGGHAVSRQPNLFRQGRLGGTSAGRLARAGARGRARPPDTVLTASPSDEADLQRAIRRCEGGLGPGARASPVSLGAETGKQPMQVAWPVDLAASPEQGPEAEPAVGGRLLPAKGFTARAGTQRCTSLWLPA